MDVLKTTDLRSLVSSQRGPCVSIYMPGDPVKKSADAAQSLDAMILATLSRSAQHFPIAQSEIKKFFDHLDRKQVASALSRGMAIFYSGKISGIYQTNEPLSALAVVASSFHIKPLLPTLQKQRTFYVLRLTDRTMDLYEGDDSTLMPLHSFVRPLSSRGPADTADLLEFMARASKELQKFMHRPDAPLILFGANKTQAIFKIVNQSHPTTAGVIEPSPSENGDPEAMHSRCRTLARALLKRAAGQSLDSFEAYKKRALATDSLHAIARAVVRGEVETLILERGVELWGSMDRRSGDIIELHADQSDKAVDDLLDDIAEQTYLSQGQVRIVETIDMPSASPVCAILARKPLGSGQRKAMS